jgi:hypothetical protein
MGGLVRYRERDWIFKRLIATPDDTDEPQPPLSLQTFIDSFERPRQPGKHPRVAEGAPTASFLLATVPTLKLGAPEWTRTTTDREVHKALNLARLPIPPRAQGGEYIPGVLAAAGGRCGPSLVSVHGWRYSANTCSL